MGARAQSRGCILLTSGMRRASVSASRGVRQRRAGSAVAASVSSQPHCSIASGARRKLGRALRAPDSELGVRDTAPRHMRASQRDLTRNRARKCSAKTEVSAGAFPILSGVPQSYNVHHL